jgi:hypothetical protein
VVGGEVVSSAHASTRFGIVELADVCARQRAVSLDLFTELGAWVAADTDVTGEQRRWFSTACHRHAWHAELWARRSPAIPPVDLDAATDAARHRRLPDTPDADTYRGLIDTMLADLDRLAGRIDPDLDPATHRVIMLVRHDLTDLAARPA